MRLVIPNKLLLLGVALSAALACMLACTTSRPMPQRPPDRELAPLMEAIRIQSRDFKRVLVLKNRDRYPLAAQKLVKAANDLAGLPSPSTFTLHVDALREKANRLAQAAGSSAPQDRMNRLFNDLVGACSSCHHIFRN